MSWRQILGWHFRGDGDNIPLWNNLTYSQREKAIDVLINFATFLTVMIILTPMIWMFSSALRSEEALYANPTPLLPPDISFEFYQEILTGPYITWALNSIIVTLGVITLTTITATLGGYGLTRIDIPFKIYFARGILFGYMFPSILLAIPMFIFWSEFGWVNTYTGVILGLTASSLPFCLWLMWKFFQTVPVSLEESARVCGASRFRAFTEIALPMALPGIIAVAIYAYAIGWNSYTIPLVLLTDPEMWVITIGIDSFTEQNQILWGQIMAASSITLLPSFIFVYFLQKYILQGFKA